MTSRDSVGGDERLRLFCALRLPDDVLDRVEPWQAEHLREGRIVPREHLHLTLAFLGRRPAADLPAITAALEAAARRTGEIVFAARRYRETRSVGMLVLDDAEEEGRRLAERLFDGLEALGVYHREKRPWLPHVTVLRFRQPPRLRPPVPDLGTFSPSDAAVYISRLRPSGAQYEVLESVALGG
ncbi:MAG TPA: RNA 2',3'-cyclic phosphodiesterase [Gaiellaceae bacterium]|jgi:2'-5' RNA ligase|nr:RNA 2',3'-cyclic phosphodiesterase [Gaiellaceae bacterium]